MWGNMATPSVKIQSFITVVLVVLTTIWLCAEEPPHPETDRSVAAPLEAVRAGVTTDQIIRELLAHNELRKSALVEYASRRTYQVVDLKGKVHAEETGRMEFHA